MVYVILAAGIILIILGTRMDLSPERNTTEESENSTPFDSILSDNVVLKRLDSIDERLSRLEDQASNIRDIVSLPGPEEYISSASETESKDANTQITVLKDKGLNVEEIAAVLGMTKGEVLLRLGMKK